MESEIIIKPKKKRSWLRILGWFVFSLFLLVLILANGIGIYAGNIVYDEINVIYAKEHQRYDVEQAERLNAGVAQAGWENVSIVSPEGYALKGTFVPNPIKTDRTVLFLHGFTQNRLAGLDYLPMYRRAGFNVLLVDMRAHGESGGDSVTWGAYEKQDVDAWLEWLNRRLPGGVIGVHGISMGAVTALLHAAMDQANNQAAFYIADSAYTSLKPLLMNEIKAKIHLPDDTILPDLLLGYGDLVCYANGRFTFAQSAPLEAVRHIAAPVLYIHGEADRLVPARMSEELYQNTPGVKELSLVPKAAHAMSFYQDQRLYERTVKKFIANTVGL